MRRLLFSKIVAAHSLIAIVLVLSQTVHGAERDLFNEALGISRQVDPDTDLGNCRLEWQILLKQVRKSLDELGPLDELKKSSPTAIIEVLNKELLITREVTYISNKYWRDSLFTSALMKKRGNCLSTALLYHLVAEEFKLPIRLAFLPEHAYVRWDDGKTVINIETTKSGRTFTDELIMQGYGLTADDLKPNRFLCSLTDKQIHAELLSNWSSVFYSIENRERANQLHKLAREEDPDNSSLRMSEAFMLLNQGRAAEAEKLLKELVAETTNGPWASGASAMAYSDYLHTRGKTDEAISVLESCYKTSPQHMTIAMLNKLGQLYRQKRNFATAIKYHKLHSELMPNEGSYNQLGSVLTEAHEDAAAIDVYEKALKLNPESFFTRIILAGLYERSGDKERGRRFFENTKKPRENLLTWYCALVWYYANIKEKELMLQNMEAAFNGDRSGHIYQYFVREPDLDPYREDTAFKTLMNANKPEQTEAPKLEPVEAK
jgi:tetratricopeptide (TPR) repeat protein